jgi:2-hydroxy-3-oxopropionate reductase
MGRTIGFIGTGLMGRGMARSRAQQGPKVAATPAEAARGAGVVVTLLADPQAVADCFEGPQGFLSTLSKDAVVIDSCVGAGQYGEDVSSAIKHLERAGGVEVASRNRS